MTATSAVAVSLGSGGCRSSSALYGTQLLVLVRNRKPSAAEGRAEAPLICCGHGLGRVAARAGHGWTHDSRRFPRQTAAANSSRAAGQASGRAGESGAGPFVVSPGRPPRSPCAEWPLWSFQSVQEGGNGDC